MINATYFLRFLWFIFFWLCTITKSASKLNGQGSSPQASLIFILLTSEGGFLLHKTHLYWATVLRLQHSYWWCGLPHDSRLAVPTQEGNTFLMQWFLTLCMLHPTGYFVIKKTSPIIMKTKLLILQEVYFTIMYFLIVSGSSEFLSPQSLTGWDILL